MSSLSSAAEQRRFAMTIVLKVEEGEGERQVEKEEVEREKRVKEVRP